MDFNRPVYEEERPSSSRVSSSKTNPNAVTTPIDEPRSKSDLNEDDIIVQNDEQQDQDNLKDESQINQDEANQEAPVQESEENLTLDETLPTNNQNDLSLDESQTDLNASETQEALEKEIGDKQDPDEHIYVHKTVKRKTRQPNKFADGNLIPEEGDDEDLITRSPGPPPLDPISQILDSDQDKPNLNNRNDLELGATTPDKNDLTIDEDYQEIEIEVKPTREELIARYQSAIEERDRLQNANNQFHHKLADFFRKKKSDDAQNQPLFEKSSQEQEQRYIKYLATIENLKKQLEKEKLEAERELDELRYKCETKKEMVDQDRINFTKMKKDAAVKSVSSQTGKQLTPKDIEVYIEKERLKEVDVVTVRIENIKLKNQLRKKENELKAKEEFGEGLHMIDFEQLKIENQTYNEKIEERNEELMKLKKKINNTVQILTHVKEKLQFVMTENEKEKHRLSEFDEQVKKNRDSLTKIKQSKDALRIDNSRLKQNSGLLGNSNLLRDFEECVDKTESLEVQIENLKRHHAELILTSKGIKQKISQMKGQ
ncbi:unnamed protein product [Brachionus calyciflorus]|uniref:CCDC113/CCDC96 coiled-coil domain-containing protein n=1 Tax=Brachionus calyciflorus TaxID=104777 RepID=A0A813SMT3_9BILA|nr:unnamed protein product [Brachionus calyciflorus]